MALNLHLFGFVYLLGDIESCEALAYSFDYRNAIWESHNTLSGFTVAGKSTNLCFPPPPPPHASHSMLIPSTSLLQRSTLKAQSGTGSAWKSLRTQVGKYKAYMLKWPFRTSQAPANVGRPKPYRPPVLSAQH